MSYKSSVKTSNGKIVWWYETVGPSHDPYRRHVMEMYDINGDFKWRLVSCGLAGEYAADENGNELFRHEENFNCFVTDESKRERWNAYATKVEKLTSQRPEFWDRIPEWADCALLAKYGYKEYTQIQAMIDADRSMYYNCI